MATIQITIPDAQLTRVVNSFTDSFGYAPMILDNSVPPIAIPNPETRNQFAKRMVAEWVKQRVITQESFMAAETARAAAIADGQTITIT